ncbi:MAG: cadherin domain-containing protein [Bacteroidota bacterium]
MKTLKFAASFLTLTLLLISCNKNENPPEVNDQEFTVKENSPAGTIIGAVVASDPDEYQVVSFELIEGNENQTFRIDPNSGIVTVEDPGNLDYESHTYFDLSVSVSDNHEKEPLESAAAIKIFVTDENEYAPVVEPQLFSMDENPDLAFEVGTVVASDEDTYQNLVYSLIESETSGYFEIDQNTGALSVSDPGAFDFEKSQQLQVEVEVADDHDNSKSSKATITVTINDVIEFTDGLLAYYPFEGNANDVSGNEIHGVVHGASLTTDRFDNANSAYQFDGVDDYIRLTNESSMHFGNDDFSISAWYSLATDEPVGKVQAIFATYHASDEREYILGAHPTWDSIYMKLYNNGQSEGGNLVHVERTVGWHMVTVTKNSSHLIIYLDGEFVEQTTVTSNIIRTGTDVLIGAVEHSNSTPDWLFYGKIDDVSVHNRVLEDWEILNTYQKEE